MVEDELESMERALAGVSSELAAARPWKEIRPRVLRGLRRPFYRFALWVAVAAAFLIAVLIREGGSPWAVLVLLVFLPDQIARVNERRKVLASASQGDLLQLYVKDLEDRRSRHLIRLLVDPVLALGCATLALIGIAPKVALVAAAFLVVRLPFTILVEFRRAGRELEEVGARDSAEAAGAIESDDEESWLEILGGLALAFLRVFVQWFGIPLGVLAAVRAASEENSTLPLTVAIVLIAGSILCWITAPEGDEDDEDEA